MEKKFKRSGFEVKHLAYPTYKKDISIADIASMSMQWANDIRDRSTHVTFIGHGMGGRIGLEMLALNPVIFDSIVTIATPYGASPLIASVVEIEAFKNILEAVSPLSLEMAKDATLPDFIAIPALSISAQFDSFIAKEATASIIENHTTIYHCTHSSILLKERTFLEILGWLNYAVFGPYSFGGQDIDDMVV
jgi:pimeloyl-ACP methyl ester carboxylesterase